MVSISVVEVTTRRSGGSCEVVGDGAYRHDYVEARRCGEDGGGGMTSTKTEEGRCDDDGGGGEIATSVGGRATRVLGSGWRRR